jgi:cobalt-zinc-cadmium efflux system protein
MAISEGSEVLAVIKDVVNRRYGISHTTLELECVGCDPDALYCSVVHSHKPGTEADHRH